MSGGGRESVFSVLISSVYVLKKHSTILFLCVFFIDSMAEGVGVQPSFQLVCLSRLGTSVWMTLSFAELNAYECFQI